MRPHANDPLPTPSGPRSQGSWRRAGTLVVWPVAVATAPLIWVAAAPQGWGNLPFPLRLLLLALTVSTAFFLGVWRYRQREARMTHRLEQRLMGHTRPHSGEGPANGSQTLDSGGPFSEIAKSVEARYASEARHGLELSEAAGMFRSLIETTGFPCWCFEGSQHTLLYLSPAVETVWGRPREFFLERPGAWLEAVHPEDRGRVEAAMLAEEAYDGELVYRILRPDGSVRWIRDCLRRTTTEASLLELRVTEDITQERAQMERFRFLLDHAPDAHVLLVEDRIVDCNPAAVRLLEADSREELLSLSPQHILPAEVADLDRALAEVAKPSGLVPGSHQFDWNLLTLRGRSLPVQTVLTRVVLDGRRHIHVAWKDISDRIAAETTLRSTEEEAEAAQEKLQNAIDAAMQLARDAEAANHAKSDFLATVSHEIRTPMNAVMGFTHLLLESGLRDDQRPYGITLRNSAEALLVLIDDILDFSKIEAGRLNLETISFNISDCIADIVRLLQPKAREKGIGLDAQLSPEVPEFLVGDPVRFRQIVLNLAGNAVKFTHTGHVHVNLRLARPDLLPGEARQHVQGSPYDFVLISVTDTGIGIPREAHAGLFQKFTQADSSTTRRFGGTGLGLAISKRLVELMGGLIGVQSEEKVGSTFWFILPIVACSLPSRSPLGSRSQSASPLGSDAAAGAMKATDQAAENTPPCVLLADDNEANQMLGVALLEKLGSRVEVAHNGAEAVAMAAKKDYELVLMDCHMPVKDGYSATREIRAQEREGHRVPIIALTANAITGDREKCLAAGMDDYLSKPIRKSDLVRILSKWTRGITAAREGV